MPPRDGPTTAATRSMPSERIAARPATAMSSTAISGKSIPYGRPVRGSTAAGLDEPKGLPSELTHTTKNLPVSSGRPSPIIVSHQPGRGSSGDEAACADGESPVNIRIVLSRASFRRPQHS